MTQHPLDPGTSPNETMTKEAATVGALALCREFLSDWSRVNSIVNLMEDAVLEEVREAGTGQMETWLPEVLQ